MNVLDYVIIIAPFIICLISALCLVCHIVYYYKNNCENETKYEYMNLYTNQTCKNELNVKIPIESNENIFVESNV